MDTGKPTSVDSNEIEYFNKVTSNWWKDNRALLLMNKIRIPLIKQGLIDTGIIKKEMVNSAKPFRGLRILDVGCGAGYISETLASLGCTIVGLDLASNLLDVAKAHAKLTPNLTNLTYILESIEDHALNNFEKYDAVVASEVVEHVADADAFLENCTKCLKPGGSMFITTINKTWSSWWYAIVLYEYVLNIIPRGTHQWEKFISPEDVSKILAKYNLKTVLVRGFQFSVYRWEWSWADDKSIWYGLQALKK